MISEREIDDSVRFWTHYIQLKSTYTAEVNGEPVGIGYLNIQACEKMKHQCLIMIIVTETARGKGIGTQLLEYLMIKAKEEFGIEKLHLEVYEGNPAIRLYERAGFVEYGRHPRYLKEFGKYLSKILMELK